METDEVGNHTHWQGEADVVWRVSKSIKIQILQEHPAHWWPICPFLNQMMATVW